MTEASPIACTLAPGAYKDRIASIQALARDALQSHHRRDLVLQLHYAPEALQRVREMVRNEQACCSFLTFDVQAEPDHIQVVITAPEAAREAADMLFQEFVAGGPASSRCACPVPTSGAKSDPVKHRGATAVGVTAVTLATGAVACGACCVLPFALPAAVLAGTGSILALFAGVHFWATVLALLAVIGAWVWIARQTMRTGSKPATSTLVVMVIATAFTAISVFWPYIERQLLNTL